MRARRREPWRGFWISGCGPLLTLVPLLRLQRAYPLGCRTKPLSPQCCHCEAKNLFIAGQNETLRGQILRCAQNDTSERLRRKVYQCRAFRFSRLVGTFPSTFLFLEWVGANLVFALPSSS